MTDKRSELGKLRVIAERMHRPGADLEESKKRLHRQLAVCAKQGWFEGAKNVLEAVQEEVDGGR